MEKAQEVAQKDREMEEVKVEEEQTARVLERKQVEKKEVVK